MLSVVHCLVYIRSNKNCHLNSIYETSQWNNMLDKCNIKIFVVAILHWKQG